VSRFRPLRYFQDQSQHTIGRNGAEGSNKGPGRSQIKITPHCGLGRIELIASEENAQGRSARQPHDLQVQIISRPGMTVVVQVGVKLIATHVHHAVYDARIALEVVGIDHRLVGPRIPAGRIVHEMEVELLRVNKAGILVDVVGPGKASHNAAVIGCRQTKDLFSPGIAPNDRICDRACAVFPVDPRALLSVSVFDGESHDTGVRPFIMIKANHVAFELAMDNGSAGTAAAFHHDGLTIE